MAHLTELFEAGKMDLVESEAERMVKDPTYRFFNFEGEFNRAGYQLMGNNQMKEAVYVLQLNTKFFPESANCYDSLAEAYWKSNNMDKAIELYNKAIALDPDGPTGANAKNMLAKIGNH